MNGYENTISTMYQTASAINRAMSKLRVLLGKSFESEVLVLESISFFVCKYAYT